MADSKISALTNYTTPLSGNDIIPIVDITNSITKGITLDELNAILVNNSVASQTGWTADQYLTGSSILLPAAAPTVGGLYHLVFDAAKTGAGTATPIINIRFGTLGTTGDTSRLTFTFGAGTAAIDTGVFDIYVLFRTVGSGTSAIIQGNASLTSNLATTGISNAVKALQVTSAGFDSTPANSIIGASLNAGASAVWTVQMVRAEFIL